MKKVSWNSVRDLEIIGSNPVVLNWRYVVLPGWTWTKDNRHYGGDWTIEVRVLFGLIMCGSLFRLQSLRKCCCLHTVFKIPISCNTQQILNPGTCQQACRIIQPLEATVQLYHSNHMNLVFILHSWYVMKLGKIIIHLNSRLCAWVYFLLETSYGSDPDHAKHTHQSRVAHALALVLYYRATSTCTPHFWLAWSMSMSMCNISRISKRNK